MSFQSLSSRLDLATYLSAAGSGDGHSFVVFGKNGYLVLEKVAMNLADLIRLLKRHPPIESQKELVKDQLVITPATVFQVSANRSHSANFRRGWFEKSFKEGPFAHPWRYCWLSHFRGEVYQVEAVLSPDAEWPVELGFDMAMDTQGATYMSYKVVSKPADTSSWPPCGLPAEKIESIWVWWARA